MAAEAKRGMPSHVTHDLVSDLIILDHDELRERMSGNLCRCGAYNGIIEAIADVLVEAE
jgi:xanthine dehydrogenase YagT iron-sulfur-binding subunit